MEQSTHNSSLGIASTKAGRSPASGLDGQPGCCTLDQGAGPCQPKGTRVPEDSGLTPRSVVTDDHGRNLPGSARGEALVDVGSAAGATGSSLRLSVKPRRGAVRPAGLALNDSAPKGAGLGGGATADIGTPPPSNTGVTKNSDAAAGYSRFDWYRGTVLADWKSVIAWLTKHCLACIETGPGKNGYARRFEGITVDGDRFTVDADGNNGAAPSMTGSGENAPSIASLLRSLQWEHRVTRADSAIDVIGDGMWEELSTLIIGFAHERNLKLSTVGDWLVESAPAGRTLYVGSRESIAYLRLYEKGKQLGDHTSTWVRAELEVKPDGSQREKASHATADDLWGYSKWARELAPLIMNGFTPNIVAASRHHSTDEFRLKLIRTFRRNRRQFSEGITRYGQEGFLELLLRVLQE